MYRCERCDNIFEEPNIITTTHGGAYEAYGHEEIAQCPLCGYDDMTEVVVCDDCEKAIPRNQVSEYVEFSTYRRDDLLHNKLTYINDTICNDCLHDFCERYFT